MLFTNNGRFKENFLIAMIGSKIENTYKRYEYSVYDELRAAYDKSGRIEQGDIQSAVRALRECIADSVFDTVEKEYNDSIFVAERILEEYRASDTNGILTTGPSIALVYSIVIKMVMGDEFDFHVISPTAVSVEDLKGADFIELAGVMLSRFEQYEAAAIRSSLEILVDDGILESYPDYE